MKLDLGCGPNKLAGFEGVDRIAFPGVEHVFDIGSARWPFADGSVEEAHTSHFLEHLTAVERIHFVNELYRVLKPGAVCKVIVPHWASNRAYGDPTHQWPPVSEMWFRYLDRSWREREAPHTDAMHWTQGFACDFASRVGYGIDAVLAAKDVLSQQYAIENYKDAVRDIVATVTKRGGVE